MSPLVAVWFESLGLGLIACAFAYFGTKRDGMSGEQKRLLFAKLIATFMVIDLGARFTFGEINQVLIGFTVWVIGRWVFTDSNAGRNETRQE